jgi:general nucleoside transport system permease protein
MAVCLGLSGALAGLAGIFEVAGTVGQLQPACRGYGFTAIIVAFLGRLNPVGILLAGCVMALTYIGGENAQIMLRCRPRRSRSSRGCCCSSCSPWTS